ncbi:alpha/beta fold hydrolase [Rhodococcus antarcticus]|uniref:Alpha/beta fold hydrolase n=1 Tax=Rhodococcus antarcticus TaxID=2987751 RepID=A0ABY6NWS3_9NOCA|nr:alpha/beta fold hydrolase [Rhodococcus antarcticus]UZJ23556.1 alpha/beta fold hydrolase [Rhodococcus antarcticus]
MALLAGAEPFVAEGTPDAPGVLLCHGFTGTPQSMRPWGEHLAAEGFAVRCPRLPGHGTRWQEMNTTRWPDWYATLEAELDVLVARGRPVLVFGLSMGGTLALRLAQQRPEVAGLVLVNPSLRTERRDAPLLPLLSRLVGSVAGVAGDIAAPGVTEVGYDRTPLKAAASLLELCGVVRADLGTVRVPVLLYRSRVDHVVDPSSALALHAGLGTADLTEVVLENSFHVATLDVDAPLIFTGSVELARRVAG